MGCPSQVMSPESMLMSPMMARIEVVFPEPFGPRNPMISPGRTVRLTASSACTFPNRFDTPATCSTARHYSPGSPHEDWMLRAERVQTMVVDNRSVDTLAD